MPLVVAKVDRLTRSVAFLSRLLEAGVDVRFADLPEIEGATGKFLLQQMAAVAELEAGMISARTKAALAAAKRRGVKLGGDGGVRRRRRPARPAMRPSGQERRRGHRSCRHRERAAGGRLSVIRAIAVELDARGIPAGRGSKWSAVQVSRLLARVNPSTVQRISRPFDGPSVAVA